MDKKPLLIVAALAIIFMLEGVFPHYRGRAARVRHAVPHVLTAIVNGLLTKFALAGITIQTIAWAESRSLGLVHRHSLSSRWGC